MVRGGRVVPILTSLSGLVRKVDEAGELGATRARARLIQDGEGKGKEGETRRPGPTWQPHYGGRPPGSGYRGGWRRLGRSGGDFGPSAGGCLDWLAGLIRTVGPQGLFHFFSFLFFSDFAFHLGLFPFEFDLNKHSIKDPK